MLEAGIRNYLTPQLVVEKKPCFDTNDDSISPRLASNSTWYCHVPFGLRFQAADRNHTGPASSRIGAPGAFFPHVLHPGQAVGRGDYRGGRWFGRSVQSKESRQTRNSLSLIHRTGVSWHFIIKEPAN